MDAAHSAPPLVTSARRSPASARGDGARARAASSARSASTSPVRARRSSASPSWRQQQQQQQQAGNLPPAIHMTGAGKKPKKRVAAKKAFVAAKDPLTKRTRRRKKPENFHTYIYRVLKLTKLQYKISQTAMRVLDSFVKDMFERIAKEASHLCHINKRSTLTGREIQTAVRLILPGDLSAHAVSEGIKAVNRFLGTK